MAFDIVLRDNGAGTFDINLQIITAVEKSIIFLGSFASETSDSTETSSVFVE